MYDLTVIIPTYNEELTINRVISEVDLMFKQSKIDGEILVVDDNSPDCTAQVVRDLQKTKPNLGLFIRMLDRGLSQSVVFGFAHAHSEVFVVVDADLSHPPSLIPVMYDEIKSGYDVVIGSRYAPGGGIADWPMKRRIISFGGTALGRLLFPTITDPVSGFFAVRKNVVCGALLKPRGYKILLEVLGRGNWTTVKEVPFKFIDRESGTSKLKISTMIDYVRQVIDIALSFRSRHRI